MASPLWAPFDQLATLASKPVLVTFSALMVVSHPLLIGMIIGAASSPRSEMSTRDVSENPLASTDVKFTFLVVALKKWDTES